MYELPGVYPGRCMYYHTFLLIEQTTLKKKQCTTHATERRRLEASRLEGISTLSPPLPEK